MSDKIDALATYLAGMSDNDLAEAMRRHPETIKRAQKAISEARRKEAEEIKERAADEGGAAMFDLKAWQKAKRLLTGPHNPANAKDLMELFKTTDPSVSPAGESSLMVIALEYLSERQQVDISWPKVVFDAGAKMEKNEIRALCSLINKRSSNYGHHLGEGAMEMLRGSLARPFDWAGAETELNTETPKPWPGGCSGFSDFLRQHTFREHYGPASAKAREAATWRAFENLAAGGCAAPCKPDEFWTRLASQPVEAGADASAKADAFAALIERGWCDQAHTKVSDNLRASAADQKNCGSRAALEHLTLDGAAGEIFGMLCEREAKIGFERYDGLGRSRLFFANERLRSLTGYGAGGNAEIEPQRQILLVLAQRCLELGDSPESVNCQNPLARAASEDFARVLAGAIEAREISGVAGVGAASRRTRSL